MQPQVSYKLVQLACGAYSVHSLAHRETFHPVIGPVAEAEALYVQQLRLAERILDHPGDFVIWDVGLGAAANVLTVMRATRHIASYVRVVSFDHTDGTLAIRPCVFTAASAISAATKPQPTICFRTRRSALRMEAKRLNGNWCGRLSLSPSPDRDKGVAQAACDPIRCLLASEESRHVDSAAVCGFVWPSRSAAALRVTTYSRSTMLRASLLLAGFFVGTGHATGEKEETTIAANTLELIDEPLDWRWLHRARKSTSAEPLREPRYRQAPLTMGTWEQLCALPQFATGTRIER